MGDAGYRRRFMYIHFLITESTSLVLLLINHYIPVKGPQLSEYAHPSPIRLVPYPPATGIIIRSQVVIHAASSTDIVQEAIPRPPADLLPQFH